MSWKMTFDLNDAYQRGYDKGYDDAMKRLPEAVEVEVVTKGFGLRRGRCPKCGSVVWSDYAYCPGCGSRVRTKYLGKEFPCRDMS